MMALIALAAAGSLSIQPDHLPLHVDGQPDGVVTITNTGNGRVTAAIAVTHYTRDKNCDPGNMHVTPMHTRLLPGHSERVHVSYSGAVGCLSAVGITVGPTEVVVPVLVGDPTSQPTILQAVSSGVYELTLDAAVIGDAPVHATLSTVQQQAGSVARLPDVSMVLLPHQTTPVTLELALPLSSLTQLDGLLSWNGIHRAFSLTHTDPAAGLQISIQQPSQ